MVQYLSSPVVTLQLCPGRGKDYPNFLSFFLKCWHWTQGLILVRQLSTTELHSQPKTPRLNVNTKDLWGILRTTVE
jgi:hypothetical protein